MTYVIELKPECLNDWGINLITALSSRVANNHDLSQSSIL